MPRKKCIKIIDRHPENEGFLPISGNECSERIELFLEEYEAIRLIDYLGLSHEEAGVRMEVSRPTITRIYERARKKISTALVDGKKLLILPADYSTNFRQRCNKCEQTFSQNGNNQCFCNK